MHRKEILSVFDVYASRWTAGNDLYSGHHHGEEAVTLEQFRSFVLSTGRCFDRENTAGHITGSSLILSSDRQKILLTHHKKLNKWLQLGGHSDGNSRTFEVALKEAQEESGLDDFEFFTPMDEKEIIPQPFDLDIHEIPARKAEPAHLHYDVRYLLIAKPGQEISMTDESNDLRWFTFEEARAVTSERSMLRQFDKAQFMLTSLKA